MDNKVSIQEEKLTISPEERELMLSFFKRLKSDTDSLKSKTGSVLSKTMIQALNAHVNDAEIKTLLPEGHLTFYHDLTDKRRGVYDESRSTIFLNIESGVRKYDVYNDTMISTPTKYIEGINYSRLIATFAHEYIHYKQHHIASKYVPKGKLTLTSKKPYLRQSDEQQAWAIGYLELIRQQLPHIDTDGILKRLKRLGITDNPELMDLKKTDYKAWKAIMKNIIMTLIQNSLKQEPSKKL